MRLRADKIIRLIFREYKPGTIKSVLILNCLAFGALIIGAVSQQLPNNGGTYRLREIHPFISQVNTSMAALGSNVVARETDKTGNDTTQQWVIKDLNTKDNTTSLLNLKANKYAGFDGAASLNREIVLVNTPARFQLVPYSPKRPQYGFQISIPAGPDAPDTERLVMVRGRSGNQVVLRHPMANGFNSWIFDPLS